MTGLDVKTRRRIRAILRAQAPDCPVFLVGSRAGNSAKPHSDVDLLIVDTHPLSLRQKAMLKDAFDESDIPYKVDVLTWSELTPEFRVTLLRRCAVLAASPQASPRRPRGRAMASAAYSLAASRGRRVPSRRP